MTHKRLHLHNEKKPDDEQWILVRQDDIILDALVEHDVAIKKACTNGVCGVCLTPLLSGEIAYGNRIPHGLNEKEQQAGYFLPCIATCKTDICIGPPKVKLR